jgi:hypothetical protein
VSGQRSAEEKFRDGFKSVSAPAGEKPKIVLNWHDADIPVQIPPKPPSLVDGLIYKGVHNQLVGKPKAGKTTWTCDAIDAIRHGRPFLNCNTTPVPILYVSEQPKASLIPQLMNSGLVAMEGQLELLSKKRLSKFHFLALEDYYGLTWSQLVELVGEDAQKKGVGLVCFDTFSKIAQVQNENDAGEMCDAASRLNVLLSHGIADLLLTHAGKMSEGRVIQDAGRGSNALAGVMDTILWIQPNGKELSQRKLEGLGRLPLPLEPLVVGRATQDASSRYELIGSEARAKGVNLEDSILKIWESDDMAEAWLARDSIITMTGCRQAWVRSVLERMCVIEKKLESRGTGKRGSPLEYRVLAGFRAERKEAEEVFKALAQDAD